MGKYKEEVQGVKIFLKDSLNLKRFLDSYIYMKEQIKRVKTI